MGTSRVCASKSVQFHRRLGAPEMAQEEIVEPLPSVRSSSNPDSVLERALLDSVDHIAEADTVRARLLHGAYEQFC